MTRTKKTRINRQRVKIRVWQRAKSRVKHGNAISVNASFIKVSQKQRKNRKQRHH